MSKQYREILKYVGLFSIVQGLNTILALVRGKITALLLGPGGVGLLSVMNTVLQFLSSGTNLGIKISAVKELSCTENSADSERRVAVIRTWSAIAAVLGFVVTVAASPVIDRLTFSWGNHTLHYLLLAPAVAAMALTGGETAVLKGTRHMRELAVIQLATVVLSVAFSVFIYFHFGIAGVVPVLLLICLTELFVTACFSLRYYPLRMGVIRQHVREGIPMLRLGLSFVIAGIVGSGVEMYVRAFLNHVGNLETVGLYYAAFSIAITYPSALLASLENDYFARLSSANDDNRRMCDMINAQIEVLLMVMLPVVAIMMVALPVAVPVLFSSRFIASVPIAQIILFAMFLRTVTMPIEYLLLAKGESRSYLCFETLFGVMSATFLTTGYYVFGIEGLGLGWVAEYIFELLLVTTVFYRRWGYVLSRKAVCLLASGILLLGLVYWFFGL